MHDSYCITAPFIAKVQFFIGGSMETRVAVISIIIEEFGLITGIVILLVYLIMVFRILILARKCVNVGNALICYGIACYIALHVIINLVGVLGLLPLTGVPLPFLSYGGSFALSLSIALAIVQRISIENYNYLQKKVLEK